MPTNIINIDIANELDAVLAYKRAMQLSGSLGVAMVSQTKFATAVSEICRNVVAYVGRGSIAFNATEDASINYLEAVVTDHGRGIANIESIYQRGAGNLHLKGNGITNSRKLVDFFDIKSEPDKGTTVTLRLRLPRNAPAVTRSVAEKWMQHFDREVSVSPYAEIKKQNIQLLELLEELRLRNLEAEQQLQEIRRLNNQLHLSNQEINLLLEERGRKNLLLEKINKDLDAFAHTVSHDLRGPLQNINGLASVLEACMEADHKEEAQRIFPMLRQQTHKMDRLITSILAYSLAGHSSIPKKTVDLQVLLYQVITSLSIPANFRIEAAPDMPVLYTQEVYLYQVFSNIIGNAIKYHDAPEQALVEVKYKLLDGFIQFTIQDNGPGIPEEMQQQIFEMYETGGNLARSDSTGLGLSIVKKIVEEKGGNVWVNSSGRGSMFAFTWPSAELVPEKQR